MAVTHNRMDVRQLTVNNVQKNDWTHKGDVKYRRQLKVGKVVDFNTHGNVTTLNWDTIPVPAGFTRATYTLEIAGAGSTAGIFWAGISTVPTPPSGPEIVTPPGSILNVRSVNGSNPGKWSGAVQLDPGKQHHVYLGSDFATRAGAGAVSAAVTFE